MIFTCLFLFLAISSFALGMFGLKKPIFKGWFMKMLSALVFYCLALAFISLLIESGVVFAPVKP